MNAYRVHSKSMQDYSDLFDLFDPFLTPSPPSSIASHPDDQIE